MAAALLRSAASRSRSKMGIRALRSPLPQPQPPPAVTRRLLSHVRQRQAPPPPILAAFARLSSSGPPNKNPLPDMGSSTNRYKQDPLAMLEKNQETCNKERTSGPLREQLEEKKKELLDVLMKMTKRRSNDLKNGEPLLGKEEQLLNLLQEIQSNNEGTGCDRFFMFVDALVILTPIVSFIAIMRL